jgi:hypothetical protein
MKKNKYGEPTPNSRIELEHNLYLVIEDVTRKVRSGKQDLIENVALAIYPHLKEVKKLPNGRIDLVTLNEMIRLQANMAKWIGDDLH